MPKLGPCPTCKKKISTEAVTCPSCGQPLGADWHKKQEAEGMPLQFLIWGALFIVVLMIFVSIDRVPKPSLEKTQDQRVHVSATEYGVAWPYPDYSEGVIDCYYETFGGVRRPIAVIWLGGKAYGLNGAAKGVAHYLDDRSKMRTDPATGLILTGAGSEILNRALAICGQ